MFENFLIEPILSAINNVNISQLCEIRLRAFKPVVVYLKSKPYFLSKNGITTNINEAIVVDKENIEEIIYRASEFSLYAVNEEVKNGFITLENGIRIGIAGTAVFEKNELKTVKNFSSINIRIPHIVKDCSLLAFKYIFAENLLRNTLVISPPGAGKTTFLKDIAYQFSVRNYAVNILVVDERGEIASVKNDGRSFLDCNFCDVISFMPKNLAINFGIRSLSPNLILTDEVASNEDVNSLFYAGNCGVKVIASVHASSLLELKNKPEFERLLKEKFFSRFVILSLNDGPGTYEGIYDENFERLY